MQGSILLALGVVMAACAEPGVREEPEVRETEAPPAREEAAPSSAVSAIGDGNATLPADELERGRRDDAWRRYLPADSPASRGAGAEPADTVDEAWSDISPATLNSGRPVVALSEEAAGPSVARVQILLDRSPFSPGIIDGYWGKNTAKAIYWLQRANGLPASGALDGRTYERIVQLADAPERLARRHTLTAEQVEGPFVRMPADIYERAALDCTCYESLREKLAEMYHASPELLEQLNPGVDLAQLSAGDQLVVPALREPFLFEDTTARGAPDGRIAKIIVSDGGHWVHAVDSNGEVLYHYPSTLGSEYAPSPTGDYHVDRVAWHPTWHYQPDLLTGEPDHKEDAVLPAGPNNAVGVVWMDLSKPHYGIHGTGAPETIGYVTSHGCVRLTNWDAAELARRVDAGVPVEFTDEAR